MAYWIIHHVRIQRPCSRHIKMLWNVPNSIDHPVPRMPAPERDHCPPAAPTGSARLAWSGPGDAGEVGMGTMSAWEGVDQDMIEAQRLSTCCAMPCESKAR